LHLPLAPRLLCLPAVSQDRFSARTFPPQPELPVELSARERANLHAQSRALWWAAVVVWATLVNETAEPGFPWRSVLARLGMGGLMALAAQALPQIPLRRRPLLLNVAAPVLGLSYWLLVAVSGGAAGRNFNWSLVLPLAGAVVLGPAVAGLTVLSALNVGLAVYFRRHTLGDGSALMTLVSEYTVSGALAIAAAVHLRSKGRMELDLLAELRDAQKRSTESERLALVGRLAAGVAHEINNPLGYVKCNLEFIRSTLASDADPEVRTTVEETLDGIARIARIVADLKALVRSEDGAASACVVGDLVQEALRVGRVQMKDVGAVATELPPDLPQVQVHPHRLVQVMLNLLVNAADALHEEGNAARPAPQVRIHASQEGNFVRLCVDDNGPGLPREHRERLFLPFFTTKPPGKGTGLGLAVSKSYLERVGGALSAEDLPTGGARFTVSLPVASAP